MKRTGKGQRNFARECDDADRGEKSPREPTEMIPIAQVLGYIGANVRRLRLKRGLSQGQFAEVVDLHSNYIHRLELGGVNISVGVLFMLAHALDVKPEALFKPAKLPPIRPGRRPTKTPAK
jgi:DNA-binding XRE family transcriptional regulator